MMVWLLSSSSGLMSSSLVADFILKDRETRDFKTSEESGGVAGQGDYGRRGNGGFGGGFSGIKFDTNKVGLKYIS